MNALETFLLIFVILLTAGCGLTFVLGMLRV